MASRGDVRRFALALPGVVEDQSSRGTRAWTIGKKLFVWERPLRSADLAALGKDAPTGAILAFRTADLEMKEAILGSDPRVFFTIPHFEGYPAVLVRLEKIAPKTLKNVVLEAWLARAPKRAVAAFLRDQK